jgi:hypothetical protein
MNPHILQQYNDDFATTTLNAKIEAQQILNTPINEQIHDQTNVSKLLNDPVVNNSVTRHGNIGLVDDEPSLISGFLGLELQPSIVSNMGSFSTILQNQTNVDINQPHMHEHIQIDRDVPISGTSVSTDTVPSRRYEKIVYPQWLEKYRQILQSQLKSNLNTGEQTKKKIAEMIISLSFVIGAYKQLFQLALVGIDLNAIIKEAIVDTDASSFVNIESYHKTIVHEKTSNVEYRMVHLSLYQTLYCFSFIFKIEQDKIDDPHNGHSEFIELIKNVAKDIMDSVSDKVKVPNSMMYKMLCQSHLEAVNSYVQK